MKIIAQPYTFTFPTEEEFKDSFAKIFLGETQYEKYKQLHTTLDQSAVAAYEKNQKTKKELQSKLFQLTCKIKTDRATAEEHTELEETSKKISQISLDKVIGEYVTLKENLETPTFQASRLRSSYIQEYNPKDRQILIITGQYAPSITDNLANALRADGGILTQEWPTEENQTCYDYIYRAARICGDNNGKDTWPILARAKSYQGTTLFFLNQSHLYEECSKDPELAEARKLIQEGKKIMIITQNYGRLSRFY